jgi:hypothetical protein
MGIAVGVNVGGMVMVAIAEGSAVAVGATGVGVAQDAKRNMVIKTSRVGDFFMSFILVFLLK